jgi:hypothetical protein
MPFHKSIFKHLLTKKKDSISVLECTLILPISVYVIAPNITFSILSPKPKEQIHLIKNYLSIVTITFIYITKV